MYYEKYLANLNPKEDIKLYSFRLGYFFHLICDILWAKRIATATKRDYNELFEKNPKEAINIVKDDWYGLDQLYVRDHPESNFWQVIMVNPNPPSYLPFIQKEALHQQYEHIRKYYSAQDVNWFMSLPYQYLNETTMSRIIADSIATVLHIHEKVQSVNSFDGLQSSAQLLPEALTTPYQSPLGN